MNNSLTVYADGACSPNPGRGGWAWATSMTHFDSGFATQTTNQQMELTAALKARMAVQGPIEIVSDSTYVVNCFKQRWYEKWRTNGWRNSGGTPVKNRELLEQLIELAFAQPTEFRWIKGHSGTEPLHDFVDELAVQARLLT